NKSLNRPRPTPPHPFNSFLKPLRFKFNRNTERGEREMATVASRVFKGCRALLAPARSSSASASASAATKRSATTKTTPKPKPKPKPKAKPTSTLPGSQTSGILKVVPVSPSLAEFLGTPESSRTDAVKQIWAYIKTNELQNPVDKRQIFCDKKLKAIFDGKDQVGFLEIAKLLTRHFVKTG
ncbi:SWIB domain-containing protein, partial [Cephalotus follicularis]